MDVWIDIQTYGLTIIGMYQKFYDKPFFSTAISDFPISGQKLFDPTLLWMMFILFEGNILWKTQIKEVLINIKQGILTDHTLFCEATIHCVCVLLILYYLY